MINTDLLSWSEKYYECLIILIKEDYAEPEKLKKLFEIIKKICAPNESVKKDNNFNP